MCVLSADTRKRLIEAALMARTKSYSPYSDYGVGAALLTKDGRIFTGSNIENASYGATNCAERTAFFKAVCEGCRDFTAIAIAGGMNGCEPQEFAYPCGICRQVMKEFCADDFVIIAAKNQEEYEINTLAGLLPHGFGGSSII